MSGLLKAKKYNWKDSNLALFGSDVEKSVKKDSAYSEKAWKGAGEKVGLQIWRVVKFKVVPWPKEDYGKFYNGDSYIILNTYKKPDGDELLYDVHFWIGTHSTQDEYGTAAYKTVELDTLLDDKPVQHREVQSHESSLFKRYFPTMELLKGGAETGFRHVLPESYEPRLFIFHGDKKNVLVKQVGLRREHLTDYDVFILDMGLEIFQLNGGTSSKDEKFKAAQFLQNLKSERSGKPKVVTLEYHEREQLYGYLADKPVQKPKETVVKGEKSLYRLSDALGDLKNVLVKEGYISMSDFQSQDVFIFDTTEEVFVWVGGKTSENEKKNGMTYAHRYLMTTSHPLIPVTVLKEGSRNEAFNKATVF